MMYMESIYHLIYLIKINMFHAYTKWLSRFIYIEHKTQSVTIAVESIFCLLHVYI